MGAGSGLRGNLLEYLEQSARRFPDKTAFSDGRESLTFAQLRDTGREIGTAIVRQVKGLRLPVAVVTSHRVCDIAAFAGVLYAGCFYVPLDGAAPKAYTDSRIDAIRPSLILDSESVADLPQARADGAALLRIREAVLSGDPAYAIFTSGSTGSPKAAVISHSAVINLAEWLYETFGFSERTVFAGQCPFFFDASVKEIYSTWKNGCTTHLIPKKLFSFPLKVMRYVEEIGANVLPWAVSAVKMTANSGVFESFVPGGIRDVIFGGENMPSKILNIWKKAMPDTRFTNVYGPTETAVDCAYYTVARDFPDGESVPIGRPCRNTELMLLGDDGKPVPEGMPGEIYVRGAGVGLGYFGEPLRTAEVFVQNPLNASYRETVYRTGDIAKYNQYGELVFLSRGDSQVKHMGNRVELGEVETAASGLCGVRLVCCFYDRDRGRIVLLYEGGASERDLAAALRDRLPRYMQPNVIMKTDEMPSTPNGKVDRRRVKEEYLSGL